MLASRVRRMTDKKSETELVRCEGCQEMVHPVTEHGVSLTGVTVVTVYGCPTCGPRDVVLANPSLK
jgi:hypothetical protein